MTAKLIRILLTALACLVPSSALHCQDAKALERNLAEARAAIKAKDYTGARLSAKAALLVDESSQEAFILLSDAYAGLNQKDDAIKAALDTVDAPAKGNKNAAGFTGRAVKRLGELAATLATFVSLRTETISQILKIRQKALKDKRSGDDTWLVQRAALVHPSNPEVEKLTGGKNPRAPVEEPEAPSVKKADGNSSLLLEPANWTLRNAGPGSQVKDGVLTLMSNGDLMIAESRLLIESKKTARKFKLTLETWYKPIGGKDETILFVTFMPEKTSSDNDHAVCLRLTGARKACFLEVDANSSGWKPIISRDLPPDSFAAEQWCTLKITWDAEQKFLTAETDTDTLFKETLDSDTVTDRYLSLGYGSASEGRFRNLTVTK